MAVVYSENIIEIAVVQSYALRPVVNVWHMFHNQELTGPDKEGVVRDFANNWQDHILTIQSGDVQLKSFEWRSLDPLDGTVGSLAPDAAKNVTGQRLGENSPPNIALLVHKNTSNRPRGRRDGRSFLVGVVEADVGTGGGLTTTAQSAMNSALAAFYNGISDTGTVVGGWNGDSYPAVLETTPASRLTKSQNGGVEPPAQTINSRRVTSITIDPLAATQRERMR